MDVAKRAGVWGPYFDERRGHWKLVYQTPSGERFYPTYRSPKRAEKALKEKREELELGDFTVSQAIDAYLQHQRDKGNREGSVTTTRHRLQALLSPVLDMPVLDLTERRSQRLYDALVASGAKVDTHRNALNQARSWGRWCAKRGYLEANPFADVEGVGRRVAGEESKPQLTTDEARKLVAWCLANPGPSATGTLLCLGLGLRASEACALEPRDLDDGGALLIVRGTKSDSARRRLHVPEWLRPVLAGSLPLGYSRYALLDRVKRCCRKAGVTEVGPHALRGTHASLASGAGAASELVAQSLGHASVAVTERHYATEESRASARAERASLKLVKGGKR